MKVYPPFKHLKINDRNSFTTLLQFQSSTPQENRRYGKEASGWFSGRALQTTKLVFDGEKLNLKD